jgi:hypothetical protein
MFYLSFFAALALVLSSIQTRACDSAACAAVDKLAPAECNSIGCVRPTNAVGTLAKVAERSLSTLRRCRQACTRRVQQHWLRSSNQCCWDAGQGCGAQSLHDEDRARQRARLVRYRQLLDGVATNTSVGKVCGCRLRDGCAPASSRRT